MSMSEAARVPLTQARRVEVAAGVLASIYGLIAVGVVSFAPQVSFFTVSPAA